MKRLMNILLVVGGTAVSCFILFWQNSLSVPSYAVYDCQPGKQHGSFYLYAKRFFFFLSLLAVSCLAGSMSPIPVKSSLMRIVPGTVQTVKTDSTDAFVNQAETAASSTELIVIGDGGLELLLDWPVTAVNYLFTLHGDGRPAYEYEQIVVENGRFRHSDGRDVTLQVAQLLTSLTGLEPVENIRHANLWTDDYPEWFVTVAGADSRSLLIYSESVGFRGHAPWYVQVEGQLYRQISGDIGFALYDLVSVKVQNYFSLEGRPYDETSLDLDNRNMIYRGADRISGLLPIARSLEYTFNPASNRLSGTFIITSRENYETSSQAITLATQIRIVLPDGSDQRCVPNVAEVLSRVATRWFFDCSLLSDAVPDVVPVEISFNTTTETILTSAGSLRLRDQ